MSAMNIFIDENDDYTDDNEFVNLLLFSIIMVLKNSIMKILMTLIMLLLIIDGNDHHHSFSRSKHFHLLLYADIRIYL